jgi:hypothetical protein
MPDPTRTIRVTLWPHRDLVVGEAEYRSLLRQGLVLDPEPAPVAAADDLPDIAQVAAAASPKSGSRKGADTATSIKD